MSNRRSDPANPPAAPFPNPAPNLAPGGGIAVVAIGASAGGLEAATRLMGAVPPGTGLAFILVQHLDPSHASMMVELLAGHTVLTVGQAAEGVVIAPEHLYVIPPGFYLSVVDGVLRLSSPPVRQGARLPFDFLLLSLAASYGSRAACVVLSGTGADGSIGLLAVRAQGGLVLAQEPDEAAYDGMPRSAIRTGGVERVLPIAAIPAALIAGRQPAALPLATDRATHADRHLAKIIDLLRTRTANDFTSYKTGTLQRRVQRRMALLAIKPDDMGRYLSALDEDADELEQLSRDLLINVTSFFRDAAVFDVLAKTTIPDLVQRHDLDRPLRVWVAGCSTGEETYSLTMLFLEAIGTAGRRIKLQVFASDIDADAIAVARDGTYPDTIEGCVSPERLTRFFSREDGGYRATPELRATIVFTAQDVLTDPPFSRLDMASCRNLLIYLQPDAQAKVITLLHFALCDGGVLLLGSAETIADAEGRFETVAKAERIYRRIGRSRSSNEVRARPGTDRPMDGARFKASPGAGRMPARPTALADLGRRLVLDMYAPAALLINAADEILFSLGPIDRYLRLATGHATHDLLAMARPGLRAKLRAAMADARQTKAKSVVGGRISGEGVEASFNLEILPVLEAGEELLLVCFVAAPRAEQKPDRAQPAGQQPRVAELERELETTRTELHDALRDLELSSEEQKAASEEALSVNEEYQSTNEELLTSKEELQSLNEELTALNSQLQETLERQRTTSDDLQNVLYSTNVATLFLDLDLRIRFFTPATKSLFAVIAGDVGRPLADLSALTSDRALDGDARAVLAGLEPIDREIEGRDGVWFRRRILPYRAHGGRVEGVVITFTDVTARKNAARALEAAKQQAEAANAAKSRFLAAASHDLRQPLQTLSLLQGMLAHAVEGAAVDGKAQGLVTRLDDTLGAMTAMLDALLDIDEIESGAITAQVSAFPIGGLLDRLRDEFTDHAQAKGLVLHVLPSSLEVTSDPRLLAQMIRNLVSNALKYTLEGRVLVGCRRRGVGVGIEVWDTGLGIPESQIGRIFDEYHQIGNQARERSRGLGLGLSIVKRLGELLGHRIGVRSEQGRGSCFAVEVPLAAGTASRAEQPRAPSPPRDTTHGRAILVVEDDPEVRDALEQLLRDAGHDARSARDGPTALAGLASFSPELLLVDYNLPNGANGIELAVLARKAIGGDIPVVVLTGDLSIETERGIERQGLVRLNKPVRAAELMGSIDSLFAAAAPQPRPPISPAPSSLNGHPGVFVIDDDSGVRGALVSILEDDGRSVAAHADGEAFLRAYRPGSETCLLIDACLPGMSGIDLLERLRADGDHVPAIVITGQGDVATAIRAMKAGASDFIEKPVGQSELLACVARATEQSRNTAKRDAWHKDASRRVADLTDRQREIMALVLAGQPSKNIAADLGISQRTVENHRASIMSRMGAASLPALARLALAARPDDGVGVAVAGPLL